VHGPGRYCGRLPWRGSLGCSSRNCSELIFLDGVADGAERLVWDLGWIWDAKGAEDVRVGHRWLLRFGGGRRRDARMCLARKRCSSGV
jgi:hypothetical protein